MNHEWVRDFCRAHAFQINVKKSKYFISNCKGPEDPRWLPSLEGNERITPQGGSVQFRYLGLWLSMDLIWTKQLALLNKEVMDWRWKALAAKVDPAQLKSSVVEFLFPRMGLGLMYADVTREMCDGWMSTILHTICSLGRISTVTTLNRSAFLVLADIPDLWMRTQTTRSSELLVNLNTKNCDSGRSTVARVCSLVGLQARNAQQAIHTISLSNRLNKRVTCRSALTIQYLKELNVKISICGIGDVSPLNIYRDIKNVLQEMWLENPDEEVIAYTDGSTDPKGRSGNSGVGIALTDSKNNPIWSGGMAVRSDGNNFIPEIAAASVVIKACPAALKLTVRSDSLATLGALSKGAISERKRVRSAGRPWLNFCRKE